MNVKDIFNILRHFLVVVKFYPLRWRRFFLILAILMIPPTSNAEDVPQGFFKQVILETGQFVVVAEGQGEPRSIGSYSVRLYSGKEKKFPFDDFLGGLVRPRDGFVEKLAIVDLDNHGDLGLVVIVRNAGSGSYLSADAFVLSGSTISFLQSVSGISGDADPVDILKEQINASTELTVKSRGSSCGKANAGSELDLPAKGSNVSLSRIKEICVNYGLNDLLTKIEKDPPPNPFTSDGCSMWFGTWKGVSLYPACFLHDLKYWAGYPGEEIARLSADAELMIDIACLTGSTSMAETMFQGTRRGGHEMYKQSFSWGFGRNQ